MRASTKTPTLLFTRPPTIWDCSALAQRRLLPATPTFHPGNSAATGTTSGNVPSGQTSVSSTNSPAVVCVPSTTLPPTPNASPTHTTPTAPTSPTASDSLPPIPSAAAGPTPEPSAGPPAAFSRPWRREWRWRSNWLRCLPRCRSLCTSSSLLSRSQTAEIPRSDGSGDCPPDNAAKSKCPGWISSLMTVRTQVRSGANTGFTMNLCTRAGERSASHLVPLTTLLNARQLQQRTTSRTRLFYTADRSGKSSTLNRMNPGRKFARTLVR